MALVKLGAFITDVSGKIGGQVFNTSRYGVTIKNIGSSSNVPTASQQKIRIDTGNLSQLWRGLTDVQRNSFDRETGKYPYINRVGETKFYAGYQLFYKMNQGRIALGLSIVNENPVFGINAERRLDSLDIDSRSMVVKVLNNDNNNSYVLYASNSLSPGINNGKKYVRSLGVFSGLALENGLDIINNYNSVFNSPVAGQRVFVGVKTFFSQNGYSTGNINISSSIVS